MSAVLDEPKSTTLATLRKPLSPEQNLPVVHMGFGNLQGFELMQRGAKVLAASTLVPPQFQGNLPNCIIALNMANRIGADPLLVMQNLYVVHGRPGWSAKFLIASFNQCGRFSALRFEWSGTRDKDDWGCRAWAVERETGEKIRGPLITIALAKKEKWYDKSGSKWQTIPELMLQYRAAAWLVNTHAPEISMGLNTAEELGDVYNATAGADGQYQVTTDELQRENGNTPPVNKETGETESLLDAVRRHCAAAVEIQDKAVALLKLDDARVLLPEMTKENAAEAKKLIDAAVAQIDGRLV
jgi:hypothetical protein